MITTPLYGGGVRAIGDLADRWPNRTSNGSLAVLPIIYAAAHSFASKNQFSDSYGINVLRVWQFGRRWGLSC